MTHNARELLERGRTAIRTAAFDDAARAFSAALALDASAEAYEGLSWVAWYTDDGPAAIDTREKAYSSFLARGDSRDAARVALWLAVSHLEFEGNEGLAQGWFGRAADLLDALPPSAEHGWMSLHQAAMAVEGGGDAEAARRAGEDVTRLARELGDGDLENVARAVEGLGRVLAGDVEVGMRQLAAVATSAITGEVLEPVLAGWTCCYVIYGCEAVGEYDRATDWCREAIRLAERMRMPYLFRVCRCHYAAALIGFGDWEEAERELVDAIAQLRASRPSQAIEGIARLADLRRRQGSYDEALELYREAEGHPLALVGEAAIALDRGEFASALASLERALRRVPDANGAGRFVVLDGLAEARLATGDVAGAGAAAEELGRLAERYGTRYFVASAKRRLASVLRAQRDLGGARAAVEDALDLFRAVRATYEVAATRLALAGVLGELGDHAAARDQAEIAAEDAQRLGARALWAQARALLRTRSEKDVLTVREREVLELVGEGLTDQQIADQLHLSSHTVHRHVANIRTKLGVTSRAAAVAYARRR